MSPEGMVTVAPVKLMAPYLDCTAVNGQAVCAVIGCLINKPET